jgi:type IV secretory pathway component VirB8
MKNRPDKDYIQTLESLVCFFAKCYVENKKTYRDDILAKGKDMTEYDKDLVMNFHLIQGLDNKKPIELLADYNSKISSKMSISEIASKIKAKYCL